MKPLTKSALALWLLAIPLLALSWYRPKDVGGRRARALPVTFPGFSLAEEFEITPRFVELLGTSDAAWREYRGADGQPIFVVAVFHGHNWKSIHPPHICLEGSDMEIRADGTLPIETPKRRYSVGRIIAFSRSAGREYLSLYVYGANGLVTASYSRFVLHHAPAALFRSATSGFLLRVETWVEGGDLRAAETRCGELLARVLLSAEGLLETAK